MSGDERVVLGYQCQSIECMEFFEVGKDDIPGLDPDKPLPVEATCPDCGNEMYLGDYIA